MAGRFIDEQFIDQLTQNADIVGIIGDRVKLRRVGSQYVGLCPFHQEKTPSFSLSPNKNLYHCFGCQASGNVLSFLMQMESLDFVSAVERLAEIEGVPIVYAPQQGGQRRVDQSPHYAVLRHATDFYKEQLRLDKSGVLNHLQARGIPAATIKNYGLGLTPARRDGLWQSLGEEKLRSAAIDLGLVKRAATGELYDIFYNRIMFPIHNLKEQPIGFGGRALKEGKKAKYINSADSAIFHKGREFYGLPQALRKKRKNEPITLVEGYTDVLAFGETSHPIVACLGTALTAEHAKKLFRHTDKIVFAFDGDSAGQRAAAKAVTTCLPFVHDERDLAVIFLPEGEDPNSLITKQGVKAWNALRATTLDQFLLRGLRATPDMTGKTRTIKELARQLALLPPGHRKKLIHKAANELTGIDIDLPKTKTQKTKPPPARRLESTAKAPPPLLYSFAIALVIKPDLADQAWAYWQEDLKSALDCADAHRIQWIIGLLRAGRQGSDYLYGYLAGRGYDFQLDLPSPQTSETWILRGIGKILLQTYGMEKKSAIQQNKKEGLEKINNRIIAIKQKDSRIIREKDRK